MIRTSKSNVGLFQAAAELKERKQDLQDLTVLLRCVETERDQAVQVRRRPPQAVQTVHHPLNRD